MDIFEHIWTRLNMFRPYTTLFGHVWICADEFGRIQIRSVAVWGDQKRSDVFGSFWAFSAVLVVLRRFSKVV